MKFIDIIENMKHTDIVCVIDPSGGYHLLFKFEGEFYKEVMHVDSEFGKVGKSVLEIWDTLQNFKILTLSKNDRVTLAQRFFSYVYAKQEMIDNKVKVTEAKPKDAKVDIDIDVNKSLQHSWYIPTYIELQKFFATGLLPKHLNIWVQSEGDKLQNFGLNFGNLRKTTEIAKHFLILTDGKHLHQVEGLFTYEEACKKANDLCFNGPELNNFESVQNLIQKQAYKKAKGTASVGRRRSTAKAKRSKFRTGVKYVSFHYSFGKQDQAPTDTKAFCIRAVINSSDSNPVGIKIRDFECNDVGIINARHYIDSEIRRLGLEVPLYFTQKQYKFISAFGARNYVLVTDFKSELDFDKAKHEIIDRYFDIPDNFVIAESYSKRLVVDHSKLINKNTFSKSVIEDLK